MNFFATHLMYNKTSINLFAIIRNLLFTNNKRLYMYIFMIEKLLQ